MLAKIDSFSNQNLYKESKKLSNSLKKVSNVLSSLIWCNIYEKTHIQIQSTLFISNSTGDIRTLTYQICRIEEKLIRLSTFNKYMCNWTLEVRDILKNIVEKRRNCSLGAISPLSHNIFYMLLDFHVKAGTRFSLRDKRLFEISEVEITRVNCILKFHHQTLIHSVVFR